jgi:hypothetical protein
MVCNSLVQVIGKTQSTKLLIQRMDTKLIKTENHNSDTPTMTEKKQLCKTCLLRRIKQSKVEQLPSGKFWILIAVPGVRHEQLFAQKARFWRMRISEKLKFTKLVVC